MTDPKLEALVEAVTRLADAFDDLLTDYDETRHNEMPAWTSEAAEAARTALAAIEPSPEPSESAEEEQSEAEMRAELEAAGIDVDAVCARLNVTIQTCSEIRQAGFAAGVRAERERLLGLVRDRIGLLDERAANCNREPFKGFAVAEVSAVRTILAALSPTPEPPTPGGSKP